MHCCCGGIPYLNTLGVTQLYAVIHQLTNSFCRVSELRVAVYPTTCHCWRVYLHFWRVDAVMKELITVEDSPNISLQCIQHFHVALMCCWCQYVLAHLKQNNSCFAKSQHLSLIHI